MDSGYCCDDCNRAVIDARSRSTGHAMRHASAQTTRYATPEEAEEDLGADEMRSHNSDEEDDTEEKMPALENTEDTTPKPTHRMTFAEACRTKPAFKDYCIASGLVAAEEVEAALARDEKKPVGNMVKVASKNQKKRKSPAQSLLDRTKERKRIKTSADFCVEAIEANAKELKIPEQELLCRVVEGLAKNLKMRTQDLVSFVVKEVA